MISGATRVYALLGDPVAHSLSPLMQNAAFRALGLKAVYVALRCSSDDL
ncbi:MAG: shikimate dehydrogenase, partial [Gemmatimonadales bacterium]|nr:shikimate dehydrogenase [Gemmatimonadales bacterium]